MKPRIAELISTLAEQGTLLKQTRRLLQEEQGCLISLDLARLEENQQELAQAMARLARLSELCQGQLQSIGGELGLGGDATLSPIIALVPEQERRGLREAQAGVIACSRALQGDLALNRTLLEDSLRMVNRSVSFFNRLFNPGDTYGMAGTLVSRRGASRFICKEV